MVPAGILETKKQGGELFKELGAFSGLAFTANPIYCWNVQKHWVGETPEEYMASNQRESSHQVDTHCQKMALSKEI